MTKTDMVQTSVPAALLGIQWAGVSLNDWVLILSFILLALQICWFVYDKIVRPFQERRRERAGRQ